VSAAVAPPVASPAKAIPLTTVDGGAAATCAVCAADLDFLGGATRPEYEKLPNTVRIVDLFCGGGGLTLGAAEAARRVGRGATVALAVENDAGAADVYALNFPDAVPRRTSVARLFDGRLGGPPTKAERAVAKATGRVDVLLAGPPCQGHSDLNNHTRREDPRNSLYLRAVRAAQVLKPTYVLIENVPAVQHDKGKVVDKAIAALEASGYTVDHRVLDLVDFGVPQRRRRHILLAVLSDHVDPTDVLEIRSPCGDHDDRTVRWAIADLLELTATTGPDSPSIPTAENRKRMQWLLDHPNTVNLPNSMRPTCHKDKEHTYNAMYGQLSWDEPAPTITTGFGSMGQGRFVHPGLARTLTPHEAARLQTLPDFFDLDTSKGRGAWARVIGNAVPPLLGVHLIEPLLRALPEPAPDPAVTKGGAVNGTTARVNGIPAASSEVIRKRMTTTKRRDTKPELALRSALHALGLRFGVDRKINGNRRRTDVVFPTERVAVYIDGCFWHGCPQHGTIPKSNRQWWVDKLDANKARDTATTEALTEEGWQVLRFWEHDEPAASASTVRDVVVSLRRR
jgi:DNA (cytosine-5)-methyltransferase 1